MAMNHAEDAEGAGLSANEFNHSLNNEQFIDARRHEPDRCVPRNGSRAFGVFGVNRRRGEH
jgi:hypothetical protein